MNLAATLDDLDPAQTAFDKLSRLVKRGHDQLPLPGQGRTLERWKALAAVASHDLSLVKLFEGHTDALAILAELGAADAATPGSTWGTWAAEAPTGRAVIRLVCGKEATLHGGKCWCSGAGQVSHGLLTAWFADGRGPQLVAVDMSQSGIEIDTSAWQAVGMSQSASVDIRFDGVHARLVGEVGGYLKRPGFWPGGAGIAACWYGGARGIAQALRRSVRDAVSSSRPPDAFRMAALGKVDLALQSTAALLRESASFVDAYPNQDAQEIALRTRLSAEACARTVLDEVGRTLGAAPFCRDPHFARLSADLPVFIRQSHAERDFASLGTRIAEQQGDAWLL